LRNIASHWLLLEEYITMHRPLIVKQNFIFIVTLKKFLQQKMPCLQW